MRNETGVPAVLEGNQLEGMVIALVGPGTVDQEGPEGATVARPEEGAVGDRRGRIRCRPRCRSRGEAAPAQAPVRRRPDHPGGIHALRAACLLGL